jgi:UDP:flavonoid glycosyltransferase YjiC (YdhE family)
MRAALVVCGSRGDVQPMLALALGLKRAGQQVLFCSSPENADWVRGRDCAFQAVGASVRGNRDLGAGGLKAFNRFVRQQMGAQVRELPNVLGGHDLVLASGLVFGVRSVAEHLKIPYRYIAFSPAGMLGTTRDPLWVKLAGRMMAALADFAYCSALNESRAALGLPSVRDVLAQLIGPGAIAATDPALTILPPGVQLKSTQTGYMHLPQSGQLSAELQRFLDSGPPPVYVGFGSMPVPGREKMSRLLVNVARATGQRLVISRGWAELPPAEADGNCLLVDDEPHALLFPRVASVIHHGGAGTIAMAARAGVPQIVLPQAADQFQWRSQIVKLGLGPSAPILRLASVSSLAKAINQVLTNPGYRRRADEVATGIRTAEDGVALTVKAVESGLS